MNDIPYRVSEQTLITWAVKLTRYRVKELITIKKINTIKNFNKNTTKRQQLFISLLLKLDFTYQIKINKLI